MILVKKLMIMKLMILNLELVILLAYQNIKTFLQKAMFQTGLKRFLRLKKLKAPFYGHVISDLKGKEITGTSYKNCKNTKKKQKTTTTANKQTDKQTKIKKSLEFKN